MPLVDAIVRTKRKTIAIIVQPDGRVIVRAPLKASKSQIEAFVAAKADWITKTTAQAQKLSSQRAHRQFTPGERFPYLGETYPLLVESQVQNGFTLAGGAFHLQADFQAQASQIFLRWYQFKARQVISERVQWYARKYRFEPQMVRFSSARTRWGSCSSRGSLSFTWRLIMAPLEIVDYVVVHELAHLVEKNHGPNFWELVGKIVPDYKQKRDWLKQNGHALSLD